MSSINTNLLLNAKRKFDLRGTQIKTVLSLKCVNEFFTDVETAGAR